jgi:tRNA threonylcarbamoyladenosine biosynthesis protein TsaB
MHAGVLSGSAWLALEKDEGDAVTLLPELANRALTRSGLRVTDMRCLIHCEGPGSLLGLRLAAMLMETWHAMPSLENVPLLAYRSLPMAAAILDARGCIAEPFFVATQFRKGNYCVCTHDGTDAGQVDDAGLAALPGCVHLLEQRHVREVPAAAQALDCDLSTLPAVLAARPELLHPAEHATAFSPQLSQYKLWDGQRHSRND